MDFLSTQRVAMNQWLSDAEAAQHRLAKQQLDLEERQRQLDHFEKVVRQRERDVLQAEAAASSAKRAETAAVKSGVLAPAGSNGLTDEIIINALLKHGRSVFVNPEIPYDAEQVANIKKHGLKLTTYVNRYSRGKTILRFRLHAKTYLESLELDVAMPMETGVRDGHVEMTLKPGDADWTHFIVTSMRVGVQYPMPPTRVRRLSSTPKKLPATTL